MNFGHGLDSTGPNEPARPPLLLGRAPAVRHREPVAQRPGRFVGRRAVEGHQRSRKAAPDELRPPPVFSNEGRLYLEHAAAYHFLESMNRSHGVKVKFASLHRAVEQSF